MRTGSTPGSDMLELKAMKPESLRRSPGRWRWNASLGLLAVLCTAITWMAVETSHERDVRQPPVRETIVSTEIGERGAVDLPGGTRLVLNTASRVRANRHARRIVVER